jgi:uroporphyrinogen-III synthase
VNAVRVIVTRPEPEASKWVVELRQAGLEAYALPLIEMAPASDIGPVQDAWARLDGFDAVMFVSGNAVAYFFASKPAGMLVFNAQAAIKTRAFVTGPGTHAALLRVAADPMWIDAPGSAAPQFDSEALWSVVSQRVSAGFRVLVVRGAGSAGDEGTAGAGRDWFAKQVLAVGGTVEFVVAYQRRAPRWDGAQVGLAQQAAVDGSVWLFSSSEAIGNLAAALPRQDWSQARAVATHPRIAQAARTAGFSVVCESRPTPAALVASIESMQ